MHTPQDLIWALQRRTYHNQNHLVPMNKCLRLCVLADSFIEEDEKEKRK